MLALSKTLHDVSRALLSLAPAGPELAVPISAEQLDAGTKRLRRHYDDIFPVLDRAGHTLAEAIERLDSEESPDPDRESAAALQQAEVYLKHRQDRLGHSRDGFVETGASASHDVFEVLDRLDNLYTRIVATMQEVRWAVLIFEGLKSNVEFPERRSFTSSAEWLASLRED